jgi:hypothetical protein
MADTPDQLDTVRLPAERTTVVLPNSGERRRARRTLAPLPVAAFVAATWAAIVSFSSVFILMGLGVLGSGVSLAQVARLSAAGWLLGQGTPVTHGSGRITLIPLAVAALCAWRLARAGVHAGRAAGVPRSRRVRPALAAGFSVAVIYGGIAAGTAALARTPGLDVSVPRAGVGGFCLALVAAVLGALGTSQAAAQRFSRLPVALADGMRTGLVASLLVAATGAGLAGLALAVRGGEATDVLTSYHAGVLGQAGVTAVCLAYAPNLALWGATYLLGPGFAVGVGTSVTPWGVILGPLPAVPALAGLPSNPLAGPSALLLVAPLAVSVAAGALLTRRRTRLADGRAPDWWPLLGAATLAAPVAGAVLALAALASRGGVGDLAELGPIPVLVGACAVIIVGVGTVVGAAIARALVDRHR